MKLIDDWKQSYKYLTVKVGAILSAFFTLLILFSEQLVVLWNHIPQQIKDQIPDTWGVWIGGIVAIAMTLARLKKEPKLHPEGSLVQPLVFVSASSADTIALSKAGFDHVRDKLFKGKLKQTHVNNINAILLAVNKYKVTDLQQVAYILATAYHETNATMEPVREAYWLSEAWRKKNLRYWPWYGRGHVQLTWQVNYERADQKLRLGGKLIKNPDLAMQSTISAEILVLGSKEGWFTNKKLDDFINLQKTDYEGARRIINGTDKAKLVAGYAAIFEDALEK
ncbi:glycoside hydrolase family 19 protein [Acinetobacter sp. ANC 5045]|uniref:DUF7940 domain-containing protein n=1 Tax=Acinetobacter sp. ANC 5045 TaxID=2529851 RepID=UPI001D18C017|nr:glycoside hydrolase family 19 protein [Acinetobacter sp. ANC 5045]